MDCGSVDVELPSNNPFPDETVYILGDPKIELDWEAEDLYERDADFADCGVPIFEFVIEREDGESFRERDVFRDDRNSNGVNDFEVNRQDDPDTVGVYNIYYIAYYDDHEESAAESSTF